MLLHMCFIFWYIFVMPYKTTTSNDQITGFVENVNTPLLIFLFLHEIVSRPYKFNSLSTRGSQKLQHKQTWLTDQES